jgi:hypothetical protein
MANYRVLCKNSKGKYQAMECIGTNDNTPIFTGNIIYGVVLWDIDDNLKDEKFDSIRCKYPNIDFKFEKTN